MLAQCFSNCPGVYSTKTAQRLRRSEDRRSFEFVGCGNYHARPNGVDEGDGRWVLKNRLYTVPGHWASIRKSTRANGLSRRRRYEEVAMTSVRMTS